MKKRTLATAAALTAILSMTATPLISQARGGNNYIVIGGGQGVSMDEIKGNLSTPHVTLEELINKICPGLADINKGNECPETETPETGTPEVPETDKPELPETEAPETEAPETEAPETNTPETEIPETSAPETETPETSESEAPETETPETEDTDGYAQQVVDLVNAERAKEGLAALKMDATISKAALVRAKETEISFSHTRPNGSNFSTALTEQGVSYRGAGENIAWGQKSPEEVMKGWMNSPGHRANILNKSYTTIGVGNYQNASGTNYWTQLFTY